MGQLWAVWVWWNLILFKLHVSHWFLDCEGDGQSFSTPPEGLNAPGGSVLKKNLLASARDIGDMGSLPGSARSPGEGNGNPLQYSCLENPMDGGAWQATVHGVSKRHDWVTKHACMQEKGQEDIAFLCNFEEIALRRPCRCRVDIYPGTNSSNQFDSCGQDIEFATCKWVKQLVLWTAITVISARIITLSVLFEHVLCYNFLI